MTFKIVPPEISHKLTTEQIVGRRVVHCLGKFVAPGIVTGSDDDVVEVRWNNGAVVLHAWGRYGLWHVELIDDVSQPTQAPKAYSPEARLFFGEPSDEPHIFLKRADERRKK